MSLKSIFDVCLKVMGVYYVLGALSGLLATLLQSIVFWDSWKDENQNGQLYIALLAGFFTYALFFLVALLIIFKSQKVATLLLKKEESSVNAHLDNSSDTALNFSIKLFGFFSILSAIPHVSSLLSRYWVMRDKLALYDNSAMINLTSSGISAVLYISMGLALIFYSSVITDKLLKADLERGKEAETTDT
jgi:hypothetical protein